MLFTDLRQLKAILEIDPADTTEDKKLGFFVSMASSWIEELLNRDFSYKTRTQFYDGTGTQRLLLRSRPVYPNPSPPYLPINVIYDTNGLFGQGIDSFDDASSIPLVYGSDYTLRIDQDDGGSRSGILYSLTDYWIKPIVRQAGLLSPFVQFDTGSYKITYTAGWTADTLPDTFRWACTLLVAKMRSLMPTGMESISESYEERAITLITERKDYLLSQVRASISQFRNWKF